MLLDGSGVVFDVDAKETGEDLLEKVSKSINLSESDYFGFLVQDKRDKIWTWLHNDRKLAKQLSSTREQQLPKLLFQVSVVRDGDVSARPVSLSSRRIRPGAPLPPGLALDRL